MPTTMQAARIQPKRMRAQVTYYKSDSDESDAEISDVSSVGDNFPAKKEKAKNSKAVSIKPLPKRKIFPFMKLPAELKNQIYGFALRDENGIFLISKTKAYRHTVQRSRPYGHDVQSGRRRHYHSFYLLEQQINTDPEPPLPAALLPNILRCNREMYAETGPILYGKNAFTFEDTTAMHGFLAKIGPKNCALLTNITIKAWGYTKAHKAMNFPAFTMLGNAVNLQSLYISCRIHWDGPKGVAKQIYRDGHHYLETIGNAKGKYDAAVEVLDFNPDNWTAPSWHKYGNDTTPKDLNPKESLEEFRAELRKRLRSH